MRGRVTLGPRAGWLDAPQIGYYGLGMDTTPDDRANYSLKQGYGGLNVGLRPSGWLRFEADVVYEDIRSEEGHGSAPSIETMYDESTAPGLFQPGAPGLFAESDVHSQRRDGRDRLAPAAGYARQGGYYGVTLANYADLDDTYSFKRMDGELIQHLPILRENWVISLRGPRAERCWTTTTWCRISCCPSWAAAARCAAIRPGASAIATAC